MKCISLLTLCLYFLGMLSICEAEEIRGIGDKCLDAAGGSSADGTPIVLWSCHGGDNQRWEITNNEEIRGTGNKCLDAEGGSSADGTRMTLWSCHGGANQKWSARYEQAQAGGGICSNGCSANTGGCVAYEHADFDGERQDLGPNEIYSYVGDDINDEISSFRVSCGCRIIAWEHRDQGGASQVFGECQYIGDDWNDSISSWQCECGRPDQF